MRISSRFIGGLSVMVLLAACTGRQEGPLPRGTLAEGVVSARATVEKIDLKARRVTLRGSDGQVRTIKVPDDVRNLSQVKKGDQVVVSFYESVAFEVKRKGTAEPGVAATEVAGRAAPGEKPAGAAANAITVTTTLTGIDKKNGTVTLTGPEGDSTVVKVRDRSNLDRVAKGDLVEITYTEAVAVSVEPAAQPAGGY